MAALGREQGALVSGGCGFIGSELVAQLVRAGQQVIVLDNLSTGSRERLAGVLASQCTVVEGDVRDARLLKSLLPSVSMVFHLACLGLRHSIHSPEETHDVNATGTLRVLEAARRAQIHRFVYVSSSEVYGDAEGVPLREDHPTCPTTPYGASKLAGEAYSRAYHRCYGLPVVIVRPFNAYGPRSHHEGDAGEVIPRFTLRLMDRRPLVVFGDGNQTRDFTFVEDTARGILLAGFSESTTGLTINIGSGRDLSLNALIRLLSTVLDLPAVQIIHDAPRPGDVYRLVAETTRARQLLGFVPRVSMEDGLRRLAAWYQHRDASPARLLEEELLYNWQRAGEEMAW